MTPTPSVKRESVITRRPFHFELLHTEGPANNMSAFHWHDFMELSSITRGEGTYEIEDKTFRVERGDIVIINNNERHRLRFDPGEPVHEVVMHFTPELLCSRGEGGLDSRYLKLFLYDGATFANRPALAQATRRILARLIAEIRAEYRARPPQFELMIKSKLLTIVTHLIRECGPGQAAAPQRVSVRRRNIARLERVLADIRRNFRSPMRLAGIARRFSMNPSYFSDYFRQNLGITFTEYLLRIRVQEAVRLLSEGGMSVTDVAYACGFNAPASFYRAFKKIMGVPPGKLGKGGGDQ